MANPYRVLGSDKFWKSAVADKAPRAVMPVPAKRFVMHAGTLVATAGSCFAQEIGRRISTLDGVTLLRAEPAEAGQPMFSARYGNIYTARQLVQLFDRAFGFRHPVDSAWRRADGRFIDPFRPRMFPAGFPDAASVEAARTTHLAAVRRVFSECAVFVFTLGLTECWHAIADGSVFPLAPGVVASGIEAAGHAFRDFDYNEVIEDLRGFVSRLGRVNPAARIILTVSPVPLIATYTREHVLVATAHAKAVLRAACGTAEAEHENVFYFPAFEIVASPFNRGGGFARDLRTVTSEAVDHVMTVFRASYLDAATLAPACPDTAASSASAHRGADASPTPAVPATSGRRCGDADTGAPPPDASMAADNADDTDDASICDEEEIVRGVGFD